MKTMKELTIQKEISVYDMELIKSTCKTFNIGACFITLDKNNHLTGLYKFQPKGKSYFINIEE